MQKKKSISPWRAFLKEHKKYLLFLLLTLYLYLAFLFINVIRLKPDGLYAGYPNVWSDWSLHVGMANLFANKEPNQWFAYHPYYAGGKFTYGFMTNLISGLLMRAGVSLYAAFVVPSLLYIFVLVFGLYLLFYQILASKKQALLSTCLLFFSAGPGFLFLMADLLAGKPSALVLSHDYTSIEEYSWLAGNFVNAMLLPQRAFLLGLSISLVILNLVVYVLKQKPISADVKKRLYALVTAGILAGLLPITHMHSFIAVVIITGLLCAVSYKRWKSLLFFVVPAGILSVTLYLTFISGGIENPHFMQWLPGWTANKNLASWLLMWLRVWGVFLPIAFVGLRFLKKRDVITKTFFAGFFIIFALGNLIQFQPIAWDNTKLFMWSYIGFSGLFSLAIAQLWQKKYLGKTFSVLLICAVTLSGAVELARLLNTDTSNLRMISTREMALAQQVREHTEPNARFLTDTTHNHWVLMWANRPIILGYTAWALNFGFLYQQREQDVATMYRGGPETFALLEKYEVSYVVIGPTELYNKRANEAFYKTNFPVAFANENNRVYDVRKR